MRIPPDDQGFYASYPDTLHMAAVVNIHLPDTPAVLPLWVRLATACPRADLRVLNDDNLAPLQRLIGDEAALDLETLELPALLIFDDEWQLQAHWGPRPRRPSRRSTSGLPTIPTTNGWWRRKAKARSTPTPPQRLPICTRA